MEKEIEYNMVDLGLPSGLKWADRNVGAVNVQDYGDYFMWGSVTPDTNKPCDWAHAPFNNGSEEYDEAYFSEHKSEWFTDEGTLKPEYDAAHAIMGGKWRMPTSAEILELIDGTTHSVEELNGIAGMRFTSNANGNSVFMPFAGHRDGSEVISVGYGGNALSSSLHAISASYSQYLVFICYGNVVFYYDYRYVGYVVRGVHE